MSDQEDFSEQRACSYREPYPGDGTPCGYPLPCPDHGYRFPDGPLTLKMHILARRQHHIEMRQALQDQQTGEGAPYRHVSAAWNVHHDEIGWLFQLFEIVEDAPSNEKLQRQLTQEMELVKEYQLRLARYEKYVAQAFRRLEKGLAAYSDSAARNFAKEAFLSLKQIDFE